MVEGLGVQGLGFRGWSLGFRVWGWSRVGQGIYRFRVILLMIQILHEFLDPKSWELRYIPDYVVQNLDHQP